MAGIDLVTFTQSERVAGKQELSTYSVLKWPEVVQTVQMVDYVRGMI